MLEEEFTQEINLSREESKLLGKIRDWRETGTVKIVPELIDIVSSPHHPILQKEACSILFELKTQDAVPHIITALKNPVLKKNRATLISALWQSGLNVNQYLPLFVDFAISEDFVTSFECYTVIEMILSSHYTCSEEEKMSIINKINTALTTTSGEKKALLKSIIEVLKKEY